MKKRCVVLICIVVLQLASALFTPWAKAEDVVTTGEDQLKGIEKELEKLKEELEKMKEGQTDKTKGALDKIISEIIKVNTKIAAALVEYTAEKIEEIVDAIKEFRKALEKVAKGIREIVKETLETIKAALDQILKILKDIVDSLKDLFNTIVAFLRDLAGSIGRESSSVKAANSTAVEPPGVVGFELLDGYSIIDLPVELGGGVINVSALDGYFEIAFNATGYSGAFNASVLTLDLTYDSVTIMGLNTGPNIVTLDLSKPRFSLVNFTEPGWTANITFNGFVTNDYFSFVNPIRYFGILDASYNMTAGILSVDVTAADFFPPLTPPELTINVVTPQPIEPIPEAFVRVYSWQNGSEVINGTVSHLGRIAFSLPMDIYFVRASATGFTAANSYLLLLDRNREMSITLDYEVVGGIIYESAKNRNDQLFFWIVVAVAAVIVTTVGIYALKYRPKVQRSEPRKVTQDEYILHLPSFYTACNLSEVECF